MATGNWGKGHKGWKKTDRSKSSGKQAPESTPISRGTLVAEPPQSPHYDVQAATIAAAVAARILHENGERRADALTVRREHMSLIPDLTEKVASELHEMWRAPRLLANGRYEERVKPDGLGGEVDIANTRYEDLPEKWKQDNRLAAQGAVEAALRYPDVNEDGTPQLEWLAEQIHIQWLQRNAEWAEAEQKLPYRSEAPGEPELSEPEKEKDRVVGRPVNEGLHKLATEGII